MLFESRCCWWPKDVRSVAEYEDAYGVDEEAGLIAIADGVSEGFRSRSWAQLLTAAVLKGPPDSMDDDAVERWLSGPRAQWAGGFNAAALSWTQRGKFELRGGAYSTLQWVKLTPAIDDPNSFYYETAAVGDCCLFHIRGGHLLKSFPMTSADEFGADPASLFSQSSARDAQFKFAMDRGTCYREDVLALATDALAQWLLRREESGKGNDWESLWGLSSNQWSEFVECLRREGEIRVDDTTLVMAKIGAQASEGNAIQPDESNSKDVLAGNATAGQVFTPIYETSSTDLVTFDGPSSPALDETDIVPELRGAMRHASPVQPVARRALRWFSFGKGPNTP